MVNLISSATLAVPSSVEKADVVEAQAIKAADRAMNALLNNPELLKTLAEHSAQYVPPSRSAILSILWALMGTGDSGFLSKASVQRAVFAEGGGTVTTDALWSKLNPDKKDVISAADFASNEYLLTAVNANISQIREAVDLKRVQLASSENSSNMLDYLVGGADNILSNFSSNTGTVLDLFS